MNTSVSIQTLFEGFARELKKVADIDWATIALVDGNELLFMVLSSTIGSAWQPGERIPLKGTATELVCQDRQAIYEPDLKRHHRFWTSEVHVKEGIRSVVHLPLSVTDRTIGSLILASRKPNAYGRGQIKLLEGVALQIAAPIENAQLYARLEHRLTEVCDIVSRVEAKDTYVYGHSKKVNVYAVALAKKIGLSSDEVSALSAAALLHDIGKVGIPDKVLNKKEKLNKKDWEAIKAHPKLGANIVGNIPKLASAVNSILYHHERWDGSGYPKGLKGEEIPLKARILAIAESFEAMTSHLPYRRALSLDEALKELRQGAGLQFDPKLVEVFIDIVEAELPERIKIGQDISSEQPPP